MLDPLAIRCGVVRAVAVHEHDYIGGVGPWIGGLEKPVAIGASGRIVKCHGAVAVFRAARTGCRLPRIGRTLGRSKQAFERHYCHENKCTHSLFRAVPLRGTHI